MTGLHQDSGLLARDPEALSAEDLILRAALARFLEKGFHGTSIRAIALSAGLSVPGLYHYYPSKSALLERLAFDTMDDLITLTRAAYDLAPPTPVARFDAIVCAHVRFHCERSEESFVGNSELRSLSPAALKKLVGMRDQQQRLFDSVIQDGVTVGLLQVANPQMASRALVTMCTAVASWYRRSGPATPDEIVAEYRSLARSLLGISPDGAGGDLAL